MCSGSGLVAPGDLLRFCLLVECVNVASVPVISGKQQHILRRFKATQKASIYKSMVIGLKCLKIKISHI